MSNEFKREDRYIVIKRSQLPRDTLNYLECSFSQRGIPRLKNAVVVESDWPEYEPTWAAIEARVTGAAPKPPALGGEPDLKALQFHAKKITSKVESAAEKYERGESALGLMEDIAESSLILSSGLEAVRAPLKAEIERLKAELAWSESDSRKQAAVLDQLQARRDELEGLLREVVALDPRGEFMGWQLDGRIESALSKPAGSEPSVEPPETTQDCHDDDLGDGEAERMQRKATNESTAYDGFDNGVD